MIETFLILLTGHLLADFVFQPDALVRWKKKALGLLAHAMIVGALAAALLLPRQPTAGLAVAAILTTHFVMDLIKTRWLGDRLWAFSLDQGGHLAVLAALAIYWPDMARESGWGLLPSDRQALVYAGMTLVCGLIFGVAVGGVVVKRLVEPLSLQSPVPANTAQTTTTTTGQSAPIAGMQNAGRYIGWLERALTIMFVLIKQPEGVGLLLAAKSVLRFRDVQDQTDRHQAEYIIIGTFLSFGWALLAAFLTRAAIAHWL